MGEISLQELADLAIGMPEVGAVNFNALHSLLHAILQHLNLSDVKTEVHEEGLAPLPAPPPDRIPLREKEKLPLDKLEKKVVAVESQLQGMGRQLQELEKQMATLENLPSGAELLERTKSGSQAPSVVADMWQMMQMKKKIEANESGVSKAMALFQDLLSEVSGVKATQLHVEEDVRRIQELLGSEPQPGRFSPGRTPGMAAKATGVQPSPTEGTPGTQPDSVGTQAGLPGAPATQKGPSAHGTRAPDTSASAPRTAPGSQRAQATVPGPQSGSPGTGATLPGPQPGLPGTGAAVPGIQPGSSGPRATIPGTQPGASGTEAAVPGTQLGSPGTGATVPGSQPGSPGTGATVLGSQPGSPGSGATIPEAQPGSLGTGATIPGAPPGSLGTGATVPGSQPVSPGTGAPVPRTQPGSPGTETTAPGTQPVSSSVTATVPGAQRASPRAGVTILGAQPGPPGTRVGVPGAQPRSPGTGATIQRSQAGSPSTGAAVSGTQPAPPGVLAGGVEVQPSPLDSRPILPDAQTPPVEAGLDALGAQADAVSPEASPSAQGALAASLAAQRGAESPAAAQHPVCSSGMDATAVSSLGERDTARVALDEALQQLGQLSSLCAALQEQVAQLALAKCDRAELEELRLRLLEAEQKSGRSDLDELLRRVASLQSVASELQGEKAKIKHLQNVVERMAGAGAEQKAEGTSQIQLQLGCLRAMVQEIEKELKELREKQDGAKAHLEQSVTDVADNLQEQLDKLRCVMENMMASSSALLSMSVPASPELRQAAVQATCPACSLDVSEQVRQLFQRYEQLQRLVNSFVERQAEIKAARQIPSRSQQDEEVLRHVQATILQVQEDCEKLNSITGDLVDDHRQKQKDIEALFLSLEKLEKEKADKEDLVTELDVKADRAALAAKVNRLQFDATMEHVNKMVQDMLNRITGQEQDWHHIQQKLVEEMNSKLDRVELTPFRQRLEEHWKSLLKQLQEKAPCMEADDAAGIRKQLLAHFHCVSCDRSLNMLVPSPHVLAIPSMPALPSRHSGRPHAVFELEQIRQHGRSLRWGPAGPRSPLAGPPLERGLRGAHECLERHMEAVQLHYGGGTRASSHTIRDLLQLPCLGPALQRERAAECEYLSVARPCGGRHTLTHPLQRCLHLRQPVRGLPAQPDAVAAAKHDEMELLGQDGHVYKGRRDTLLPAIAGKEGSPGRKNKPPCRPWAAPDARAPLSRPQSASTPRSAPGSAAAALQERPPSLLGVPQPGGSGTRGGGLRAAARDSGVAASTALPEARGSRPAETAQ